MADVGFNLAQWLQMRICGDELMARSGRVSVRALSFSEQHTQHASRRNENDTQLEAEFKGVKGS